MVGVIALPMDPCFLVRTTAAVREAGARFYFASFAQVPPFSVHLCYSRLMSPDALDPVIAGLVALGFDHSQFLPPPSPDMLLEDYSPPFSEAARWTAEQSLRRRREVRGMLESWGFEVPAAPVAR